MRSQGRYCTPLLLMLVAASSAKQTVKGTDELDTLDEADEAENRIIGGRQAGRNQFPYQAAIQRGNGYTCGGSLVSQRWVLTAAHCVQGQQRVGALLGATNTRNPEAGSHFSWADRVHTHPQAGRGWGHDIALLRLRNPPPINNQIRPIALARDDQAPNRAQGQLGTLSGWGADRPGSRQSISQLKFGQLPIQPRQNCRGGGFQATNFCGQQNPRSGDAGCYGDSGSPYVHNGRQIGVQSFAFGNCVAEGPAGFVNVGSHLNWINQHINGDGGGGVQQPQVQQQQFQRPQFQQQQFQRPQFQQQQFQRPQFQQQQFQRPQFQQQQFQQPQFQQQQFQPGQWQRGQGFDIAQAPGIEFKK